VQGRVLIDQPPRFKDGHHQLPELELL
jgi:hypothetical protein